MIPTGVGVGLTFPTLIGVSAGLLPPSSFATGSGVINMIRQAALAIGVAISVAIAGAPASLSDRLLERPPRCAIATPHGNLNRTRSLPATSKRLMGV
jgi:hypothetical protein